MPTYTIHETVTLIRTIEAKTETDALAAVRDMGVCDFDEVDCSVPERIRVVQVKPDPLEYFINLDERGEFFADVRRDGATIFEIHGFDIFEDGFMRHKNDTAGLLDYLVSLGIAVSGEDLATAN